MNDLGDIVLAQHFRQFERLQNVATHLRDPREIYDFAQRLGLVSPVHEHRLLALFHQNAGDLRPDVAGTDDQYGHEPTVTEASAAATSRSAEK
jgi:hypothetical protein